jgi:hypothetical protein
MRKLLCLLATAVTVFFAATYAQAATISQTGSWDVSQVLTVSEPINFYSSTADSVRFAQFDSSLGTLTSVDVTVTSRVTNSGFYARNTSQQTGNIAFDGFTTAGYVAGIALGDATFDEEGYFSSGDYSAVPYPIQPSQNWVLMGGGGSSGDLPFTQEYLDPDLNIFIGTGTFDMIPRSEIAFNVTGLGTGVEAMFEVNYSSSYTIDYNYTPIPEPITLSLLGLGAIMIIRKRK